MQYKSTDEFDDIRLLKPVNEIVKTDENVEFLVKKYIFKQK